MFYLAITLYQTYVFLLNKNSIGIYLAITLYQTYVFLLNKNSIGISSPTLFIIQPYVKLQTFFFYARIFKSKGEI